MKPYLMRRARQALSDAACAAVLKRATSGVLALSEKDGTPYAVPLSFVDDGNALYFHCAKEGRKLDVIAQNPRAAFCAVSRDDVRPEAFTTRYESVTVFGEISIVEDDAEKRRAALLLCDKYAPESSEADREAELSQYWNALCVLKLSKDAVTGKASRNT